MSPIQIFIAVESFSTNWFVRYAFGRHSKLAIATPSSTQAHTVVSTFPTKAIFVWRQMHWE